MLKIIQSQSMTASYSFMLNKFSLMSPHSLTMIMFFVFTVKLNGNRTVSGILRGFDPFMNIVLDETVESCKDGQKKKIGIVVG